jgi:hypothetical protein
VTRVKPGDKLEAAYTPNSAFPGVNRPWVGSLPIIKCRVTPCSEGITLCKVLAEFFLFSFFPQKMKNIQLAFHIPEQPAFWGEQILLDTMPSKFTTTICQCFMWVVNYSMEAGNYP